MDIEKQVVSYALAKKLKDLNFSQESYFKYVGKEIWDACAQSDYETPDTPERSSWLAAFTVSELGQFIKPIPIEILNKLPAKFTEMEDEKVAQTIFSPNDWAEILIYLKENKLI